MKYSPCLNKRYNDNKIKKIVTCYMYKIKGTKLCERCIKELNILTATSLPKIEDIQEKARHIQRERYLHAHPYSKSFANKRQRYFQLNKRVTHLYTSKNLVIDLKLN